ncbi:MAG: histidine phosphatase family protein [Candidatus Limnocylindrales bacterium]|nr:histidine phosphatase family protein [Candidatus Limnocylindrales bacterium]
MASTPARERHVWLVRHGETEWARLGRHTGRTDIALTEKGRDQARALGRRLAGHLFGLVLTSPLSRAADTATIAGYGDVAVAEVDLMEWDYGALEGRTTAEIRGDFANWTIWRGPWPAAETVEQVGRRADRIVARLRGADLDGDVLVFAHGHLLRVLAARWLGLPPDSGGLFELSTATLSILSWEREAPSIELWNEGCHLA